MGLCFYDSDDHAILWKTVLLGTVMYRTMFSKVMLIKIVLLSSCVFLTACGQSGALQLPSDPNYDHRAKYLLHADGDTKQAEKTQKNAAVQQQFSAPASAPTAD